MEKFFDSPQRRSGKLVRFLLSLPLSLNNSRSVKSSFVALRRRAGSLPVSRYRLVAFLLSLVALVCSCITAARSIYSHSYHVADTIFIFEAAQALHNFGLREIFNFVYAPCTQIFPDLLTAYLASFFSNDYQVVAVFVLFVQVGVMIAGSVYFFRVILPPGKRLPACSLTVIFVAFALILKAKVFTFTFYPLGNSIHYCAFILALPISALCIAWLRQGGRDRPILMGILLFLASLSAQSTLPFITTPLLIYLGCCFLRSGWSRKRCLHGIFIVLFVSLFGFIIAKQILPANSGFGGFTILDTDVGSVLTRLNVYLSGLLYAPQRVQANPFIGFLLAL
ncbi:MAG: hypothetical protein IJD04_08485, partial [Desulfovibrionaceae bacterium]|nr:hypothetical protein [Desulfovibrionaceae bacterium]